MSIESRPWNKQESAPNQPEKNSERETLRNKVWKALSVGSLALMLQACAPTREEIDALPTTSIEDINKHGNELAERQVIKVNGWVQDLGRKGEKEETYFFAKEKVTTHYYILRAEAETNSPSVSMIAIDEQDESGTTFADKIVQALPAHFPSFDPSHKFEILGQIVSEKQKAKTNYLFKIAQNGSGIFDLTAAKPEKEK